MDKPTRVYFLRHAIAEDESKDGSDESRRLTDAGVKRARQVMRGLAKLIKAPEVILTSPLIRAAQTADLAHAQFRSPIETIDVLGRTAPQRIIAMLRKRPERTILAVGHEPTLSTVIELLIAPDADRGFIQLKKAGCACVDLNPTGPSRLVWLAPPKMLRAV